MGDLRETTAEMQRRAQELRDKQEQLVQAGKLATLGELTTGVAHELNNPLNNTGLFVGNAIDLIELGVTDKGKIVLELRQAMHGTSGRDPAAPTRHAQSSIRLSAFLNGRRQYPFAVQILFAR